MSSNPIARLWRLLILVWAVRLVAKQLSRRYRLAASRRDRLSWR
ncbi:hypothetical protein V7S57_11340 [Caulobacter sp. CCNWLY153]